ncbi:MAG: hypothetical protein JWM33_4042 [Caulobacteraceae bacterium]|nr:hypothetical protein [Caulobacteraceae bacterium]
MKPYFCYVYRDEHDVPYFEVVTSRDEDGARDRALGLLNDRPQHRYVELWEDRRLLGVFSRQGAEHRAA